MPKHAGMPTTRGYDYGQLSPERRADAEASAKAIRQLQRRMDRHQQGLADAMIQIGEKLLAMRARLPHGDFAAWWQAEFDFSTRMVQQMMAVAKRFGGSNARVRAHLNDTSLRMLAAPSVPDEAVKEALDVATGLGRALTVEETKEIIDAHKPAPRLIEVKATPVRDSVIEARAFPVDGSANARVRAHLVVLDEAPAPPPPPALPAVAPAPTAEEVAAQETAEASRRRVETLHYGTVGEVTFEWHLDQASEAELAAALEVLAAEENPEAFALVRSKVATRLGRLMEARQAREGKTSLLTRLVAVKDLLYEIDQEFPDIYRMTSDVRPPLNRLVTSLSNKVKHR